MTTAKLSPEQLERMFKWSSIPHRDAQLIKAHIAEVEGELTAQVDLTVEKAQLAAEALAELSKVRQYLADARDDCRVMQERANAIERSWQTAEAALRSRDEAVRELLKWLKIAKEAADKSGRLTSITEKKTWAAAERLEKIVGGKNV